MKEQEKADLFVQWAYLKSKKINPKYQKMSEKEWANEIGVDEETSKQLADLAKDMTDEDFTKEINSLTTMQFGTGGKLENLKMLQSLKKGGKMSKKKCACGCELVEGKESGGKIVSKCACGCTAKKENGGSLDKIKPSKFDNDYFSMPRQKMNTHKIKKFKD